VRDETRYSVGQYTDHPGGDPESSHIKFLPRGGGDPIFVSLPFRATARFVLTEHLTFTEGEIEQAQGVRITEEQYGVALGQG